MKTLVVPHRALAVLAALAAAAVAGCAAGRPPLGADVGLQRLVTEDDRVRIDEWRLRGQTQRVTVQPKGGNGRPYEILQPTPGADASQHRDAAGQRVWPVLSF